MATFSPSSTILISMRKAALLYNPLSGGRRERRLADVQSAQKILQEAGIETSAAPTRGASEAGEQARQMIAEGCDTVFACGGDGTVHDVLQGVVGTQAALGIIPLGTANALAHDIGLPLSPVGAARAALTAKPRRISLGQVQYQDFTGQTRSRYFTVAVGIGADAQMFYKLNPLVKQRFGMAAYYAKATRLWMTHPMDLFAAELIGANGTRQASVSQLLAVRIRNFGGVLRELAPGASLERDDLHLALFHTRSRLVYLRYIIRGLLAHSWNHPGIELVSTDSVACSTLPGPATPDRKIFVEADGELIGTLPVNISMVHDALTLLTP